jgi:imidazolonepropionase-like amidohydrolase
MKHPLAALALLAAACSSAPPAAPTSTKLTAAPLAACTRIDDVRLFDGEHTTAHGSLVFRDDRIVEVNGPTPCATTVAGAGKTLLPGLIDSHTHLWEEGQLRTALRFGVTTELDMMTSPQIAATLRKAAAARRDLADLRSAGSAVTAPGGHGTEYGFPVPTLARAEDAEAFVAARAAEGSDYLKIIYTPDVSYFRSIDRATLQASVEAAHRHGLAAIVHVDTLRAATDALEAGADGLAHLFRDQAATPSFVALARSHGAFVVPTLTVIRSVAGKSQADELLADPHLRAKLSAEEATSLKKTFPLSGARVDEDGVSRSVRMLRDAGVPLLAGTDAPNPGTMHGASLHGELALLVAAGLTPSQALASATSVPARTFHLSDRGRLAPGLRADLLLVDGDPTTDILATRAISAVWRGGEKVTDALPAAEPAPEASAPVVVRPVGVVSDFDEATIGARWGLGWKESTDDIAGGKSVARLARVPARRGGALEVTGEVVASSTPHPWAGVMLNPGDQPFAPVDVSAAKELVFSTRGDGKSYAVLVFTRRGGIKPAFQPFIAGKAWKEQRMKLSAFATDGSDIAGIAFVAGPGPGTFTFDLDDVALR